MKNQNKPSSLLFLVPASTAKGGIVNYFNVLEGKFNLPVEYFVRGARNWPNRDTKIKEIKRAWNDLRQFNKRLSKGDISLVQTSTSLGSFAVIRDGFFINTAKRKDIAAIAFFRGWDEKFEQRITGWKLTLFKRYLFKADAFIVLSKKFEEKLRNWGYKGGIFQETTIVDQKLLETYPPSYLEAKLDSINLEESNLLFLARTEESKGLFETIEAFKILKTNFPKLKLTIAGDGYGKEKANEILKEYQLLHNVSFTGYVNGLNKAKAFGESHIYLFPSYTEGMPNSVLEAMAFGLPVITTPVGGLTDFFKEDKNGKYVDIKSVSQLVEKTKELILNPELYSRIANENLHYSRNRFTTDIVITRLEKIYSEYI